MPRRFRSCRYASKPILPSATTTRTRGRASISASRCGRQRGDFLRRRLVVRRRAPDRGGDERVAQGQAVVRMVRRRDVGEAGAVQRGHQEVAGSADAVAGEDAAGAVGAVRRRREADDQQPRPRIAEAGDRLAPVGVVAIGAPLLARDRRAVARAAAGSASHAMIAVAGLRSGGVHLVIWSSGHLVIDRGGLRLRLDRAIAQPRPINGQMTR